MDLVCANTPTPVHRLARRTHLRRRPGHARARFDSVTSPHLPKVAPASSAWCQPEAASARSGPVTVAELSQIPGARQALADYIGILQEWSSRADQSGAAP